MFMDNHHYETERTAKEEIYRIYIEEDCHEIKLVRNIDLNCSMFPKLGAELKNMIVVLCTKL